MLKSKTDVVSTSLPLKCVDDSKINVNFQNNLSTIAVGRGCARDSHFKSGDLIHPSQEG